jgi:N-dimethylarginine dimethylaminohydrolase
MALSTPFVRLMVDDPYTYEILPMQKGQNPYIDVTYQAAHNETKITTQYHRVLAAFREILLGPLPPRTVHLPDIVFVANGGLSLPRLGRPLVVLPNMKYPQRKAELPSLREMFRILGIPTVEYPGREPFEGQAELKWFAGGRKCIGGYGHRATKAAFAELAAFFEKVYGKGNAPEMLLVRLISDAHYHLDIAILEHDDTKCIIHRKAVSPASLERIKKFLGGEDNVCVIDTHDNFCLNAVIDGDHVITHKLTDPKMKKIIEERTGRKVVSVDTSEFERSGGSVRCMTLDIHDG